MGNDEILKRIKLIMEYNPSKTKNENLVLVNEVINPPFIFNETQLIDESLENHKEQILEFVFYMCKNGGNSKWCKTLSESDGLPTNLNEWTLGGVWDSIKSGTSAAWEEIKTDIQKTGQIGVQFVKNIASGDFRRAFRDARDFFVETYSGAFVDLFVSVLGIEVGGPVIMFALEVCFAVNDLFYFLQNDSGKRDEREYTTLDGFKWQFVNNIDFQKLMVDLMILATRGVLRAAGKFMGWISKSGKTILTSILSILGSVESALPKLGRVGKFLSGKLTTFKTFLSKLEKPFSEISSKKTTKTVSGKSSKVAQKTGKKVAQKVNELTYKELVNLIKNKKIAAYYKKHISKLPSRVPDATRAGAFAYLFQMGFTVLLEKLFFGDAKEAKQVAVNIETKDLSTKSEQDELFSSIKRDNPNLKIKEISLVSNDVFLINGVKYTFADPESEMFVVKPLGSTTNQMSGEDQNTINSIKRDNPVFKDKEIKIKGNNLFNIDGTDYTFQDEDSDNFILIKK